VALCQRAELDLVHGGGVGELSLARDQLEPCWSSPITIVTRGPLKLHGLNACAGAPELRRSLPVGQDRPGHIAIYVIHEWAGRVNRWSWVSVARAPVR
jgi:hypothetical protein